MKQILTSLFLSGVMCLPASAAPLSSNAQTVVPAAVQQIISVDYSALRDSPTARALRDRVMPDNVKQFESALQGSGHRSRKGRGAAHVRQLSRAEGDVA